MKKSKKLFVVLLMFMFVFSSITSVYARDTEKPIQADIPPGKVTPLGTLGDNSKQLNKAEDKVSPNVVIQVIYKVTKTYTGYNWRGWQASYGPGGTASFSRSLNISNSYSCTTSVDTSALSSAVGFVVTYSDDKTATYSHDITSGKYGWIGYADWYNVKDFEKRLVDGQVVGTGWAKQWLRWSFHYAETGSSSIQPPKPSI